MKNCLTFLLTCGALLLVQTAAFAGIDTLRHYNPAHELLRDQSFPSSALFIARFAPKAPGFAKQVFLTLDGAAGTVDLRFYGHEAGTSFPQLEKEVADAVRLVKETAGRVRLSFELPDPIYYDNNQFFIGVTNVTSGISMLRDTAVVPGVCRSADGGDYIHVFYKVDGKWYGATGAYPIDVVMAYETETSPHYFEDVTAAMGVDGNLGCRTMASVDLDGDGFQELLVAGRLYHNEQGKAFTDVTAAVGLSGSPRASAVIDVDNDGDLDILFAGLGAQGTGRLFLNDGAMRFTAKDAPEFANLMSPSSISVADLNDDGFPDVFIGQLWQTYPDAMPNYLYMNNGDSTFTDVTYLDLYPGNWEDRRSRGSSFVDYDNDGDQDLYITNYYLESDELWENRGGQFLDVIARKKIDRNATGSNHGTGVDWGDYDADGDMDLLLPQFAHPGFQLQYDHRGTTIYRNEGPPDFKFTDMKDQANIQYEETHSGGAWGDLNNDGLLDFYITTYYGCRYVDVYLQQPDHSFKLATFDFGIQNVVSGEDVLFADFNNDGKLDVFAGDGYRVRVFKNNMPTTNNYVQFDLVRTTGNKQAIGAKAVLHYLDRSAMQEVNVGRGQLMQRPYRLHYGLAAANALDSLVVSWPTESGYVHEIFYNLALNRVHKIEEGKGVKSARPESQSAAALRVYPNPAQGWVEVDAPAGSVVSLHDVVGRLVLQAPLIGGGMALGATPPGVYVLSVQANGRRMGSARLVVY